MATKDYMRIGISVDDCKRDCKIEDWKQLIIFDNENDADLFADFIGGIAKQMTNGFLVSYLGVFVTVYTHGSMLRVAKERYGIKYRL